MNYDRANGGIRVSLIRERGRVPDEPQTGAKTPPIFNE